MFTYLETIKDISQAQTKLENTLRREFPQRAIKDIGHPGGREYDANVFTNGRYWFWSKNRGGRNLTTPRRLNWFGLFSERPGAGITFEINTAYEGRNDRAAGFFARDNDTKLVYLLHSGRVGGGTKGVGKTAFRAWSGLPLIEVLDSSGGTRNGLLVMPIEGATAGRSASRYIENVNRFKIAVRSGELKTREFRRKKKEFEDYYAEGRGRRTGRRASIIDYISRHGEIVDELRRWRELSPMPKSSRFVRNVLIDLGVAVGANLVEVFEVKTSTERPSVYSALGQLLIHGNSNNCRRVMVLPHGETLANDLEVALKRLRIQLLRFKLDKRGAIIVRAY